ARILVERELLLYKILKLQDQLVVGGCALAQPHEGLDEGASRRVGATDHGSLGDLRMHHQRIFDFGRTDAISGAFDQIVVASLISLAHRPWADGIEPLAIADEMIDLG